MTIYSLKFKSLKMYKNCFCAPDDQQAVLGVCEAVKSGLIDGQVLEIEDLSLFKVGFLDGKKGIIHNKPQLVTELSNIPGIQEFMKGAISHVSDTV